MTGEERGEWLVCAESPIVFIDRYIQSYDATLRQWVPLRLWPRQIGVIRDVHTHSQVVMLKARQLGCTTIVLAYVLWMMLFRPAATVLLFSRRDDEAVDLLDFRLKGMYGRLPGWCKCEAVTVSNDHDWELSNGSRAVAFGRIGGDSYTASLAVIDESDLIPDLDGLMRSVKPTTDAGGKLVMLSRPDKGKPQSPFKNIYRAARLPGSTWHPIFLPWSARPGRDAAWYEQKKKDSFDRTHSYDELHEQYPATEDEALAPNSQDKRIPYAWLQKCYKPAEPLTDDWLLANLPKLGLTQPPAIPGLRIYALPTQALYVERIDQWTPASWHVISADPAQGNPTSDDSAAAVLNGSTGEQCAELVGKIEPSTLADYIDQLGRWYNDAAVMVERNNHGWAVIQWLVEHSRLLLLGGHDGDTGWMSSVKGKAILYAAAADAFRNGETVLHSFETLTQLCSIEGSTLRAPEGEHDDRADAYALALVAVVECARMRPAAGALAPVPDGDKTGWWSGRY